MPFRHSPGVENKLVLKKDFVTVGQIGENLLSIKWEQQIDYDQRLEGFLWALAYSAENRITNWLINDEEIFIITAKEREWVINEFPELAARAGIRKVAVYLPEEFGSSLVSLSDFTKRAQVNYERLGVTQHEVFTDYQAALDWLNA